jgi:hypothetical protein
MTRKYPLILPLILFLGTLILYWPSVHFDFTVDDALVTTDNNEISHFNGNYFQFLTTTLYSGTAMVKQNANLYRPMLKASIALNFQLAGSKFDPYAFHLGNILLYSMCVVLVYFLILAMSRGNDPNYSFAFFTALLFMVFPSHLESVCNIKNREEILACLFSLSAWWVLLEKPFFSKRHSFLIPLISSALFLLGLLSKESAILILPCIVIWDYVRDKTFLKNLKKPPLYLHWYAAAIIIYFLLRINALGALLNPSNTHTFFTLEDGIFSRIVVTAGIFCKRYLWDQMLTLRLNPAFSSRFLLLSDSQIDIIKLSRVVLLLAAVGFSAWTVFRHRRVYSFWILYFFITSFLATNIIPTGTAGAFRLMFTPSLGLCVLVVLAIEAGIRLLERRVTLSRQGRNLIFMGLVCMPVFWYGYATWSLMYIWENDRTVYTYSADSEPENPISIYAAGRYYEKAGQEDLKYQYYEKALRIFMSRRHQISLFTEKTLDAFSVVATEVAFRNVALNPSKAIELADIGIQLFQRLKVLRNGKLDSNISGPYYVKALALKNLGRISESRQVCQEALAITYHQGLAALLKALPDDNLQGKSAE